MVCALRLETCYFSGTVIFFGWGGGREGWGGDPTKNLWGFNSSTTTTPVGTFSRLSQHAFRTQFLESVCGSRRFYGGRPGTSDLFSLFTHWEHQHSLRNVQTLHYTHLPSRSHAVPRLLLLLRFRRVTFCVVAVQFRFVALLYTPSTT